MSPIKPQKTIEATIAEVQKRDKRYNYITLIVSMVVIALISSLIIYSQHEKNKANEEVIQQYKMELIENVRLREQDSLRTDSITRLVTTLRKELAIIERDLNDNNTPRNDRATALANVNLAQDKLNRITNNISDNTIVRYYKRKADGSIIERLIQSMKDPSFRLNIKQVANDDGRQKVNTIHYGKNVDKKEVYYLVKRLLDIGIKIKNVSLFKEADGYAGKDGSIEIGYESTDKVAIVTQNEIVKYNVKNERVNYYVRFYSYNPNETTKKILARYIQRANYKLKIYPNWKEKPSFFAKVPTIFYYNSSSKAKAVALKKELDGKVRGLTFKIARGNGYGISKEEQKNTLVVHYMQ
ncbi:hypothetical protein H2O64_04250 [Kordia sp. YSTF-M3]|uniref:Uncharacterized protein n=1 Tax=Kordia aestuariivivens TaxID=2759037 RepID=A0ABR7Q5U7_9FLAO|nr:hypothetical protein [Kordia aestuariivivens]MBC8753868.1 hypothetical protein [Kordia aestuariivivens]